jgi:hypothetical protein
MSIALLLAGRAAAQPAPCGDLAARANDELDVQPNDGAEAVARNAPIVVRYPSAADLDELLAALPSDAGDACSGQAVCLFRDAQGEGGRAREPVPGAVHRVDARTLAFVAAARLRADSDYFPLIARAGFDRASRTELEFTTGAVDDDEPPDFDAADESIRIAVEPPPDECGAEAGSLRVQLGVPAAHDDGDPESVELLLFVTDGEGIRAPELRARRWNEDGGEVVLTFLLDPREAGQPVCVALRAIDGLGRSSEGEPALCFDPIRRSHFEPSCAVAGAGPRGEGPGTLVPLTAWLFVRVRCRLRRARPTRPTSVP